MSRNFICWIVILSMCKGFCMKINCTDNQILAFSLGTDTDSKENVNNYKCKEIEGREELDSIACICGWYENCESYFDQEMQENETIFVAGVNHKAAKIFYKCCWSRVFTYLVKSCKRFTKTKEIPLEHNKTHATVIANINEMRSEVLTCVAQLREDTFCYSSSWYPSTAGTDHSWIAGLVLGVVLPIAICQDPDDCVADAECCLSGYCAPTTGRCGQRPDGDLCATDNECISGVCGNRFDFYTGIIGIGYCNFQLGGDCTQGDHASCGLAYCGAFVFLRQYECQCFTGFIVFGTDGWRCCNGIPETVGGTRCDQGLVGDPCTTDINCQKRQTPRYCRNGACSST